MRPLVLILRLRRWVLRRHQDRLLTLIEKYGGITQVHLTAEWRGKLARVQTSLEDVEARLRRAPTH